MKDIFYWVFSTLPQVIAALTGLLIAGTTFFFSSLDAKASNDETVSDFIFRVKTSIHKRCDRLLRLSVLAILIDIIWLLFTPSLSETFKSWKATELAIQLLLIVIIVGVAFVNLLVFIRLCKLLNTILNPSLQKNVIEVMTKEVIGNQNSTVSAMDFFDKFRTFESEARRITKPFFTDNRYPSMMQVVNMLVQMEVMPANSRSELLELVRVRNLIAHNNNLKELPQKYYDQLLRFSDDLKKFEKNDKSENTLD